MFGSVFRLFGQGYLRDIKAAFRLQSDCNWKGPALFPTCGEKELVMIIGKVSAMQGFVAELHCVVLRH